MLLTYTVFVAVRACMHACVYTCLVYFTAAVSLLPTFTYVYVCAWCVHMLMHVYMCMHVCSCVCLYVYVPARMRLRVRTYVQVRLFSMYDLVRAHVIVCAGVM
jgi:hypothetical protein